MTNQTTNSAREYCHAIECELIALETILKCETKSHSDNDEKLLEAYAELEFENTGDACDAVHQWINETLLEFKILRTDDRESNTCRNVAHLWRPSLRDHTRQQRRPDHCRHNIRRHTTSHNPQHLPAPIPIH
jgi:hypothetical protein